MITKNSILWIGFVGALWGCGRTAPRTFSGESEARAVATLALPVSRLMGTLDVSASEDLLSLKNGFSQNIHSEGFHSAAFEESDSGVHFFSAAEGDVDSDGIPASSRFEMSRTLSAALNFEGVVQLRDLDDQDVFGGFDLAFENLGYSDISGAGLGLNGLINLTLDSSSYELQVDLLASLRDELGSGDFHSRIIATLTPDDTRRPEYGGRISVSEGTLSWDVTGDRSLVLRFSSQNLRYSRKCRGEEKFNAGSWTLEDSSGQKMIRAFEDDCSGRWEFQS